MLVALLIPSVAEATVARRAPAGVLEAEVGGRPVVLPTLKTDVDARVDGDLATVHLVQTFRNETGEALSARYVFPLPEDAAVYDMTLTTPSSVARAEIRKRDEAAATFAAAKREGKKAALLDQERPNVFVQQVANLAPGEEVRVELAYAHPVARVDGVYTWTFPMVVGPRYVPSAESSPLPPLAQGAWTVQPTDLAPLPDAIDPGRVGVTLRVDPGVAIGPIASPSHPITVQDGVVRLAEGRVLDNADLVVTWKPAGTTAAVGTSVFAEGGRGVVSLLVEPPVAAAEITPRELVFVLDTSCSMAGFPLETSKRFMREALGDLRPGDQFRLVKFSSAASELADRPMPADPESLARAYAWIDALGADGGTEIGRGLSRAFAPATDDGRMRIVVLLTDGYVGNEPDVARQVEHERGEARVFSLGIGSSVNRWLVEEVARAGRGVARVVLAPDGASEAADALAERIAAPYLTDVAIDWGGAPVRDVTPARLPDLFLGEPLRVMARFDAPGTFPVTIRGRVAGHPATLPLVVELPAEAKGGDALPITWARAQIEDRTQAWTSPATSATERERLEAEITTLGLEYRVVTRYTSFVAVADDRPLPEGAAVASVATPAPLGVSAGAFGGGGFGGAAAPEPATWLAGAVVLGLGGLSLRRRRSY